MNDTVTSVLGVLAGVLLLAVIVLAFFMVERQAHDYAGRQCDCQCAEAPKPPDSTWYNQRVWPDSGYRGGVK